MKIWMQKDVDKVKPDENGIRHYPANSSFAKGCLFAERCSLVGNKMFLGFDYCVWYWAAGISVALVLIFLFAKDGYI